MEPNIPLHLSQSQRHHRPGGGTVIRKVGKPATNVVANVGLPMFQCSLCGLRFHFVEDLVRHVDKGEHFDMDIKLEQGHEVRAGSFSSCTSCTTVSSTDPADSSDADIKFESFDYSMQQKIEMNKSLDHQEPQNLVTREQVNTESFTEEKLESSNWTGSAYYRCLKCAGSFESASELRAHRSSHLEEEHKSQILSNEAETDARDGEESSHNKIQHSFESDVFIEAVPDGYYRCKICGKVCIARSDMQKHVRRHTDERPYFCDICHERFKHRSAITNHLRIHSGEKPFSCIYCKKTFSQHSNKRRHEALHRGERPFVCSVSSCSRTFSEKTTLQTHMLQHTGQRPFVCETCNRGHITKSALTRHKCTHKRNGRKTRPSETSLDSMGMETNSRSKNQ